MQIVNEWLRGWQVRPPAKDGEESMAKITLEIPVSTDLINALRRISDKTQACELSIAPVQASIPGAD